MVSWAMDSDTRLTAGNRSLQLWSIHNVGLRDGLHKSPASGSLSLRHQGFRGRIFQIK